MAAEDFAIVVGIAGYPSFGETVNDAQNLEAPDRDAQDVITWLREPGGGAVPDTNLREVRSTKIPQGVNGHWPPRHAVLDQFKWLELLSAKNRQDGRGPRVGRRLYFYGSGHGFAPRRKEGAVFTADATRVTRDHVFASKWMEWFATAAYFDEVVLWLDTCMWSDSATNLETAGYRTIVNPVGGASMFTAFAARFPLQAVERSIEQGPKRGVFTHTLLTGLRYAADPATLEVNSTTLRSYLTNRMADHLTAEDKAGQLISKEPDFGYDDPMVFCRLPAIPNISVRLIGFPSTANGQPFSILTGSPPVEVGHGQVQQSEATVRLPMGVHFAAVPAAGFLKSFEVPGGTHVTISLGA